MKTRFFSITLLVLTILIGCSTDAQAWIVRIHTKKLDLCLAGGRDVGACNSSQSTATIDVSKYDKIIMNNKKVRYNKIDVTVNKKNTRIAKVMMKSPMKSKKRGVNRPSVKVENNIDLSKIVMKNSKTGESMTLMKYIKMMEKK